MIKDIKVQISQTSIEVSWTRPKYVPYYYKEKTACFHARNDQLYKIDNAIYGKDTVLFRRTQLDPNSECVVTVRAVYNNASLDEGLDLHVYTAPTGNLCYIYFYIKVSVSFCFNLTSKFNSIPSLLNVKKNHRHL